MAAAPSSVRITSTSGSGGDPASMPFCTISADNQANQDAPGGFHP